MVFSSLSQAQAVAHAVAPLDRAAMARPLPQPHLHRLRDDDHDPLRAAVMASNAPRDSDTLKHPVVPFSPLTTLLAAVDVVPQPSAKKRTKKTRSSPTTSASSVDSAVVSKPTKKLSTERSRLCRQRQKNHAESLEKSVSALRAEVANLVTLRDLRREQLMNSPLSRSGSLARIVREYCSVFEYGMAPENDSLSGCKRSLVSSRQLTAHQQCDFLLSIMDPDVQVFDWIGRTKRGPEPLVYGWKAWSSWHASIMFHLEGVDVIEADHDTIAVSSRGKICVKVSPKTIEQLFPHAASDEAICKRLLGSEIRYPFRDTFFFNETGRVAMYTVDMDCITALTNVVGDFLQVASLVAPSNDVSFDDRAVATYEGCSLEEAQASRFQQVQEVQERDRRLDLQFLLS